MHTTNSRLRRLLVWLKYIVKETTYTDEVVSSGMNKQMVDEM